MPSEPEASEESESNRYPDYIRYSGEKADPSAAIFKAERSGVSLWQRNADGVIAILEQLKCLNE